MIKINLKDRKILYELDKNARQPLSQIGKNVRLYKSAVDYRIKKLEETVNSYNQKFHLIL